MKAIGSVISGVLDDAGATRREWVDWTAGFDFEVELKAVCDSALDNELTVPEDSSEEPLGS